MGRAGGAERMGMKRKVLSMTRNTRAQNNARSQQLIHAVLARILFSSQAIAFSQFTYILPLWQVNAVMVSLPASVRPGAINETQESARIGTSLTAAARRRRCFGLVSELFEACRE
jgi:hypothetical protein